MAQFGILLVLFGAASAVLSFIDYELRLLFWIENWGTGVAWVIRVAFVLVGLALIMMARSRAKEDTAQPAVTSPAWADEVSPGSGPDGQPPHPPQP